MKTVSIVYFSGSGHTDELAKSVASGVESVDGVSAKLIAINGDDIVKGRYENEGLIDELSGSEAIIFGSPTYMAGPAAQFKAFADATVGCWAQQTWRNKWAAGFTVSGALSGDKLSTLQYMNQFAMQHGMIWVGTGELPAQESGLNRLGSWLGAMAQDGEESGIHEEDILSGEALGKRVADLLA